MYSYDVLPRIECCIAGIGIRGKRSYRAYDSLPLINRAAQRLTVRGKISYRPTAAASVALTIFCHAQHAVGQLLAVRGKTSYLANDVSPRSNYAHPRYDTM